MNKSVQITLLAVILGIVLSAASKTDISKIAPKEGKAGVEVEITMSLSATAALKANDIISFSTDATTPGTDKLAYKLAGDQTASTDIKYKYTFPSAGTYSCIVTSGQTNEAQTGIEMKIAAAGKFLSVSMIIGALFLLF